VYNGGIKEESVKRGTRTREQERKRAGGEGTKGRDEEGRKGREEERVREKASGVLTT